MNMEFQVSKDFQRCLDNLRFKYGEDFEYLNGIHPSQIDPFEFEKNFISARNVADSTIDSNANVGTKDIRSLQNEKTKAMDKLKAFSNQFDQMKQMFGLDTAKQWLEYEYSGVFYMNDAHTADQMPYCYAYDLERLATEGLFFFNNYNNQPPKHLTTFLDDVIEYISYMSNRSSGAVGIPNILIWTYYFWKHDCDTGYFIKNPDYYLRQNFQKLVYRLNQPFIRVVQTAFTNVSIFDRPYIEALFGGVEYPDGSFVIDNIDNLIEHQKVFMEVISDIRNENGFTFPVLTYSLLKRSDLKSEDKVAMIVNKDFHMFVDEDFARWCSDHNTKWNDSNFFISEDVGTLSNCCRLLSNVKKLSAFVNSIGGTALSVGSQRVNTTNLMRIALESGQYEDGLRIYYQKLEDTIELSCKVLHANREIIRRNIKLGLLPNYIDGGIDESKQFSTIGILGLYEVVEYFGGIETDEFGYNYYTDDGIEIAKKTMKIINAVKDRYDCDFTFNVESIPAERAAVIVCQKDNAIFHRSDKYIYSNQWIPLTAKCTIQEKMRLSSILDRECGGGAIAHINIEANFPNKDVAWEMLNRLAIQDVIYSAFNTRINECKNHHMFVGTDKCPNCGEGVYDTYQRIVGYLVPTRNYSKDRFKEFSARRWYNFAEMMSD